MVPAAWAGWALVCILLPHATTGCTTVAVGKAAAGPGGHPMVAHTNDGELDTDSRLVKIPAADHAPGSMRPVYFSPEDYPRYVGDDRGTPEYHARPDLGQKNFVPIGHIPEVPHTHGYLEETYGALNEVGLSIAESTCSGRFGAKPAGPAGGFAMFSVDALSQVAMEREATARGAVTLMGALAVKHGFYGAGSFEGTAESLLVSDPEEAWIFQVLPDDTGRSAIWAAQRVPDDHVAVVANAFTIRDLNMSDPANFLASDTAFDIAEAKGWWSRASGAPLDFTGIYSDGEYDHKYYSGRRMWRAYAMLAKGGETLSPEYEEWRASKPYPATMPAAGPIAAGGVLGVLRDHYEGTAFDMTKGAASGPFGSPNRYAAGAGEKKVAGNWERSIALYRTTDSYISVSRPGSPGGGGGPGGILWFGAGAAHGAAFVPVSPWVVKAPSSLARGWGGAFDRSTAIWATRYVSNVMDLKYSFAAPIVAAAQAAAEGAGGRAVAEADAKCAPLARAEAEACAEGVYFSHAEAVLASWWRLADELVFRLGDGWVNKLDQAPASAAPTGYPAWWLEAVGYADGPPPVPAPPGGAISERREEGGQGAAESA